MKTLKVNIEIDIPYHSYGSKVLDAKANRAIISWIKSVLKHEASYIPLYVQKDEHGSHIEDCSRKTRIRVTKCE